MQLHANISGEGNPFIILHGFLGMGDNWKTLGQQFSEQDYEVHLVDQRNHGRSFHDDNFSYEDMVTDLKHYLDQNNLDDIVLLGHSMGGKTAMLFATQYPEMVSKLLVADISPRYYPVHHEAILNGLSSLDFSVLKSRGAADKALAQYVSDFGTRQFLLKNLYWKENKYQRTIHHTLSFMPKLDINDARGIFLATFQSLIIFSTMTLSFRHIIYHKDHHIF